MAIGKKDFFGKTVADAMKAASDAFHTPQENLTIEVVETGSVGIFGFIRKKAHIRASRQETAVVDEPELAVKVEEAPAAVEVWTEVQPEIHVEMQPERQVKTPPAVEPSEPVPPEPVAVAPPAPQPESASTDASGNDKEPAEADEDDFPPAAGADEPLSQESLDGVCHELTQLLQLMGLPSKVEIEAQGSSVRCHVSSEFQEDLTGQEGKILDSLQYLLRKIVAKKISEKIRIAIDVGDFREKRHDELQDQARELAALVKADGKTQVIPSLNPSERRVVHMALQDDKEIRSRSVGDGLFKKVLIYKPGKPKAANNNPGGGSGGTGRKRSSSRGRRGKGGKPTTENDKTE